MSEPLTFRRIVPSDVPPHVFAPSDAVLGIAVEAPGRRVVGVGGVFVPAPPVDRPLVFFDVFDESYRRPHLVHRMGRGVVAAALRQWGRVYATCDMRRPNAVPWLRALGFRPLPPGAGGDAALAALEAELGLLWVAERPA